MGQMTDLQIYSFLKLLQQLMNKILNKLTETLLVVSYHFLQEHRKHLDAYFTVYFIVPLLLMMTCILVQNLNIDYLSSS